MTTTNPTTPAQSLHRLHHHLTRAGLSGMLLAHERGVSVLSVHSELTIWCLNGRITWRHSSSDRHAPTELHPATDPDGAAQRILAHLAGPHHEEPSEPRATPAETAQANPTPAPTGSPSPSSAADMTPDPAADEVRARSRWPVTTAATGTLPAGRGPRAEAGAAHTTTREGPDAVALPPSPQAHTPPPQAA